MTAAEQQRLKDISSQYSNEGVVCGNGQKARNENECPLVNINPSKPPANYTWVAPLAIGLSILIIIALLIAILVKLSKKSGKETE